MRTRSKSYPNNSNATIPRRQNRRVPNIVEPEIHTIEKVVPMADRTMEDLLQAPTDGYGEAIVILKILAENFEIKTNLLQLVQTNKFHGFERDNPHTHISNFKRMTLTLKYRDVPNDAIKLMLFPYSLEGAARIWYEKEPLNLILTWDDLVNKFINQFFPPSKTTHLKNEVTLFTQRFEETFGEAWERFKEMLRACPHHGFSELTQIDTFYNGLNEQDQDSYNAAVDGNLLSKTTREALKIIENKSKVRYSKSKSNVSRVNTNSRESSSKTDDRIDKLTNQISNLVEIVNKQVITPATAKAVEKTCVICGGAHAYYDCITTDSNQSSVCAKTGTYNQVYPPNRASNQIPPPGFALCKTIKIGFQNQAFQAPNNHVQQGIPNKLSSHMKSNESLIKNMQNQINVLRGDFNKQEENLRRNLNNDTRSILGSLFLNQASTSGTLPSNIVPNPKGEMKAITTRSGLAYEGPSIPTNSSLEKVVKRETEETTDKEQPHCQGITAHIQPPVVPISIPERDFPKIQPKPNIPYPSRRNDQKLHVCHALAELITSINLMPLSIWKKLSLQEITPTRMTLELVDRSITRPKGVAKDVFVKVGKFHFPTDFVVVDFEADPRVSLILGRSFLRTGHALIDAYGEEITPRVNDESSQLSNLLRTHLLPLEKVISFWKKLKIFSKMNQFQRGLKILSMTRRGIFFIWKVDDPSQLPPMDLKQEEETKGKSSIEEPPELELKELPSHLEYAFLKETNKLPVIIEKYLKDDEKEALIKVLKSHKRAIAWKIIDIKGIDLRFCTHKILMEEDYKPVVQSQRRVNPKIHDVIKKEVIKFLDAEMIYPISDSPYFQILIDPQDQEKTTFTCPYGTFAYCRMPFGLCNAPGTFQRCMIAIFHDMIEKTMEVFTDDFLVFWDSFSSCLSNLDKMLKRCEDTNLVLNWEKCHFMYKEGIVLGHKISKFGIEVDRAKVDVIAKLPHPTTVKGVRIFLEKEMLAVVYAFQKFRPYLVLSKSIVYTDHSALRYILSKQDAKPRLLWWILLLQEFGITIRDKKGSENLAADHLSRLENPHKDVLEN
nr:DNA-directed DNA polymerase [Tanacetum cinerariifolium]